MIDAVYAHIKTADGEEIQGLTKKDFKHAVEELECREIEKSDRVLYVVEEKDEVDGLNYLESDYIERCKEGC